MVLTIEPKEVFHYFEEISRIPRGSYHMDLISDYLVNFAKEKGLEYYRDELKNVILIKEATEGYENEPAVILQGHMDMVLVKKDWCKKDLLTEGLDLETEGDSLYAKGTSLGGDDGIAVAYSLALLASDSIRHPRLEVVITVDEEVGMDGARGIDVSMLKGKTMINLDSEEEGIFLTSCAGGAGVKCSLSFEKKETKGCLVQIGVDGLLGGHSGAEIHKERGNANKLLGRILHGLCLKYEVSLADIKGGLADNAIPNSAYMQVLFQDETVYQEATAFLNKVTTEIKKELAVRDPDVNITYELISANATKSTVPADSTANMARFLMAVPNGVQGMSMEMENLVETSLNLGILVLGENQLVAEFSVRSSVESKKYDLIDKLSCVAVLAGARVEISGDYPGWQFNTVSPLRDKMRDIFLELYGKEPKIDAIHAGVECGFLVDKIPGLDCVSIGPDMKDIHTADETLSISSTRRVWEFLLKVLETK